MRERLARLVADRTSDLGKAHQEIEFNNSRLVAMLELSQMEDATEDELARFALEQAVRLTRSQAGYFHFYDQETEAITLTAWSERVHRSCVASPDRHYSMEKAGMWADSVRLMEPVIHNDFRSLKDAPAYPEGHFPIHRHMSIPVIVDRRIIAITGVGNKQEPYDEADVQQLTLLMTDAWRIIKKRRVELEKERSEAKYRSLFDDALDMIHVVDKRGIIVDANGIEIQTLGYEKREDFIGTPLLDIVHPDLRASAAEALVTVMEGRPFDRLETVFVT